jgi:dynein heavy chain
LADGRCPGAAPRRYNYTTPKSYLELIGLYKILLERKRQELRGAKDRLQNGVEKIAQASAQVGGRSRCSVKG